MYKKLIAYISLGLITICSYANLLGQSKVLTQDSSLSIEQLIDQSFAIAHKDNIKAEQLALQALAINSKSVTKEKELLATLALINAYYFGAKYDKIYNYASLLTSLDEKSLSKPMFAKACKSIGKYYHFTGNYTLALTYYLKGLAYGEKIREQNEVGELLNALGGLYFKQKDFTKAIEYYNKSLQMQLQIGNNKLIGRGYLNVACVNIENNRLELCEKELDSAKTYYSKANFKSGIAYVYASRGDMYTKSNQLAKALSSLLVAHSLMKQEKVLYSLAEINPSIAEIYSSKKDYAKALEYINEGIDISKYNKHKDNLAVFYLSKSQVLEKLGNTSMAFKNYKLYKALTDTILNQETIKKQTTLALQYEYNIKEEKRESEKQMMLKQKAQKENFYKLTIVFIIFVGIVLFSLAFTRYYLNKKANKKVAKANEELKKKNEIIELKSEALELSLAERNVLLQEIHHRVKNNLQVISSLIDLQAAQITDVQAKKLLQETQGRISSIALLHHQLYHQENIAGVQLHNFILNLYTQITSVYSLQSKNVLFENKIAPFSINIDTAIPLGLILNELFTNTFKYAFANTNNPIITLDFVALMPNQYLLQYHDNGIGLPSTFDIKTTKTLGIRIIKQLSKQLKGKIEYEYKGGSLFNIYFEIL